jgi:RNA polymerase sigma-70 factor (ECF subfamily)
MLGSVDDAEELVQETYLRAWRSYAGFEGRSSVRTWLYRIATNACLNALRGAHSRALPSGLGAPAEDPDAPPAPAGADVRWIQAIPDALAGTGADDPAAIVGGRASLRLALIASLQHLPGRQRAVLILRDVMNLPAPEVAEILGTSTAAVKSALQRARGRMEDAAPAPDELTEPDAPEARALLDQYMHAFEAADGQALERALRTDAALEMTGTTTWFAGRRTCLTYIRRFLGAPRRLPDGRDRRQRPARRRRVPPHRGRPSRGVRGRRPHRDDQRYPAHQPVRRPCLVRTVRPATGAGAG